MANHPIVGVWNVIDPGRPAPAHFFPNGNVLMHAAGHAGGPNGVTFIDQPRSGSGSRSTNATIHFTGVQIHTDADGNYTHSVTIDGYPVISEDGQTLLDDQSQSTITIRDAAGDNVTRYRRPARRR